MNVRALEESFAFSIVGNVLYDKEVEWYFLIRCKKSNVKIKDVS